MVDDEEEMLQKAEGTDIEWASGKNPTVKARRARLPAAAVAHCRPMCHDTARAAACETCGLTCVVALHGGRRRANVTAGAGGRPS